MPPKTHTKSRDDDSSPRPSKRVKTSSAASIPLGKKFVDGDGNPYWELGGRLRRVTVSKFKGSHLISIREHYEKDGKILPGKKGISLSVDQLNSLLSVLPQIDIYLADNDIELTRPMYGLLNTGDDASKQQQKGKGKTDDKEEEEHEEAEGAEERREEEIGEGEYKKEEEEGKGEEEEEKEEVKPKRKPVQKKAEPKQKKAKERARPKKRVHSDAESD
ncbi:hypothetical protein Q9L58_002104 [Maublancomyces gigas]|uniref:Transcriptional coactivator p15 (PC4) C-terminal domain-containing protein n=1 Tax=Discina gigas TaxID=1032678 RepID=A0ABR3GSS3_9PEZI